MRKGFSKHRGRTCSLCSNNWLYPVYRTIGNDQHCWVIIYHTTWWEYQLTKTVQNGGPQAISEILHIEYRIVYCIETYLIHIYHMSKCSKCNWNIHIEGFCMWNVHFHINGLSSNIAYVILMSWHLIAIYLLLLHYWLFSVQFSYHI